MNPIVNVGIKAARQAGNIIIRYIDQIDRLAVEKKGRNDFVSEVDRMAEEEIIEVVHKLYPSHRILAEESGTNSTPETADPEEYEWIIDPLDGTTNFLHGHPDFAVSIGIRKNGVIEHAVIYDPLRNEMYTASKIKEHNSMIDECVSAVKIHYGKASSSQDTLLEKCRTTKLGLKLPTK